MFKVGIAILLYDIKIIFRSAYAWGAPLLFFILICCLFSIALSNEPRILHNIAPDIIWIAALLAILISLPQLFLHDAEEGYLDVLLLSHYPLPYLITIKIISYWVTHCIPLV